MTVITIALVAAVLAVLWWAARPGTTNHAHNDEASHTGGFIDERTNNE